MIDGKAMVQDERVVGGASNFHYSQVVLPAAAFADSAGTAPGCCVARPEVLSCDGPAPALVSCGASVLRECTLRGHGTLMVILGTTSEL